VAGQNDPDVVVVGAGPAGCATALWAARHGLRVHLLHRRSPCRYQPGETLPPAVEPILRQLGAERAIEGAHVSRFDGHEVVWNGPSRWQPCGHDEAGPWRGYHVDRTVFDTILREQTRNADVTVVETTHIRPLVASDGTVVGVRHSAGEVSGEVSAAVTVDAAGRGHWLARMHGLEIRRCSERLRATYGLQHGHIDHATLVADHGGWTWAAPVRSDRVAWVRMPFDLGSARAVPASVCGMAVANPPAVADVSWRWVPCAAGPGYVLVGDAAAVLDPLSSHGVLHALMSGMIAAEMIVTSLIRGVPEHITSASYRRWSASRFGHDEKQLRALYAHLVAPPPWVRNE
jgi:flavin-dependent dehydrogenase